MWIFGSWLLNTPFLRIEKNSGNIRRDVMFKNILLFSLIVFILAAAPSAYAGKVELTTYYPAPYGEYKELKSTENATFATSSGNVGIGTTTPTEKLEVNGNLKVSGGIDVGAASTFSLLAVNNTLTLTPVTGNAAAQVGGVEGSIRYSSDAGGPGVGGILYRNASSWAQVGGAGSIDDQSASGYVRIGNMQIAWGRGSFNGSGVGTRTVAITFPKPFFNNPAVSVTADWAEVVGKQGAYRNTVWTNTGFTAETYCDNASAGNYGFSWIAVGRWQ
jgi:hypothetical protein